MNYQLLSLFLATLWAGVVLGISFIAQPAKFGAAGLSRAVALSVGRRIFRAMHWAEGALALATLASALGGGLARLYLPLLCALILIGQVGIAMPRLSKRVDAILGGQPLAKSLDHVVFAALELIKFLALIVFSLLLTTA